MRLIDAERLKEGLKYHYHPTDQEYEEDRRWAVGYNAGLDRSLYSLAYAPTLTIDDLRPKGRWEKKFFTNDRQRVCSLCNCTVRQPSYDKDETTLFKFCPFCGAKMDLKE